MNCPNCGDEALPVSQKADDSVTFAEQTPDDAVGDRRDVPTFACSSCGSKFNPDDGYVGLTG